MENIVNKVIEIICLAKENQINQEELNQKSSLITDAGLDSGSIFSEIHSSKEKAFTSINKITFAAMERGVSVFGKATFVMDRGYAYNKMFLKLEELGLHYVIRLTAKRKLFFHKKWVPAAQLSNQRKGKIKIPVFYKGKKREAYLSHAKEGIRLWLFQR